MSEEEIEILVDDAIEEGVRKDSERRFDEPNVRAPIVRPPVSCTSSQIGSYTYTDCF
jgi:hypothetical protein